MKGLLNIILAFSAGLAASAQAQTRKPAQEVGEGERRVALVIGNGAYRAGELKGAVEDAREVTRTLRELRFDVTHKENLTQNEMKRAIRDFGARLRGGGVGLFYYTGHGLQVKGRNYLISVNSAPVIEEEVEFESVDAGLVLAQMESARNGLNIMILDASRHNPFALAFRSTSDGLARMSAPGGTLIAYATSPGAVTSERGDAGGVYTRELLRFMRVPGLSVEEVFKRVRAAVRDKTRGRQLPWEVSSLTGSFYFGGEAKELATSAGTAGTQGRVSGGEGQPNQDVVPDTTNDYKIQLRVAELYKKLRALKKQDYSEAVERYREALRHEPDNASLHHALADALKMKAEWEWFKIAKSVEAARKRVERKRFMLALLGMMAASSIRGPGNPPPGPFPDWGISKGPLPPFVVDEEVITEFEAAARLDPRNARYQNDLGAVVFVSRTNPTVFGTQAEGQAEADAERAFRKAVELEPRNPAFLRDLGNALNSQDKWKEAEAVFRRSAELDPGNVSHYVGLFIALYGQDKLTDAALAYTEIKRLKPDSYSKALLSNVIKDKKALDREVKRLKKNSSKSPRE